MSSGYILVVDDNADNRTLLAIGLEFAGYHVQTTESGFKALELARQSPPEIVLLDVLMPNMDGYTTCQAFKKEDALRDIPIIFVSALHESVDKVTGFEVGGVDFLAKPIEMEEAVARVNAHVTLYRQRREIESLLAERTAAEQAERAARLMVNALLDSLSALTNTLNVNELLQRLLSNVSQVVEYDAAFFFQCDDTWGQITHLRGFEDNIDRGPRVPLDGIDFLRDIGQTRQPVIFCDTRTDPRWIQVPVFDPFYACLTCPIFDGSDLIGTINLLSTTPGFYDQSDATRLQAFALNAALALRNARLYESSQELAVLQERQRLARELHDSVTQTLFAANTIAETLPRLLEKKPERAIEYSHELVRLTRGATAEMRSLLFELRPEAIVKTHLSVLLQQIATACAGKTDAAMTVNCEEHTLLPPETHLACYRVAQETLNNIAKHSEATTVFVTFTQTTSEFELVIRDNGKGFDLDDVGADHMGLRFMRERAQAIHADLEIASVPSQGTAVSLRGHFS
jgi:signal transduction histidine kinase